MAESNEVTTREIKEARAPKDGSAIAAPSGSAPSSPPKEVLRKATLGKKKRKMTPVIVALVILGLGAAVWYIFFRTPAKAPLVVRYAAVDVGDISRGVTATGTLQATTTVQVGSQVSGMITDLFADFNSPVKKGQLLATLDPATFSAAVTQAKANVAKATADLSNATKDEARQRQLLARQLIAQADYDASKNKLDDATATLEQQSAFLKQAEANLNYTIIRSPISGTVVSRNVDKGQTVAAGFNAPVLFVIAQDLTSMQVAANVDEADIGQVEPGQTVKFTVDAYPGQPFEGKVTQVRINSVTLQNVVTYTVIIATPNPDQKLLPGMTATTTIVNSSRSDVTRVPVAATRFIPPPELLAEAGLKDTTTAATRRQRTPGDTSRGGGMRSGSTGAGSGGMNRPGNGMNRAGGESGKGGAERGQRPQIVTVYVKSPPNQTPAIRPVKVVAGLSDGSYTEVLSSTPPLHSGDSVVVAAFSLTSTTPSGSSPLNSRPGGGGGGGGPRRF